MVKTIILFLALVITGAATYFGYSNLNRMKEVRWEIHTLEGKITAVSKDISDTLATKDTRQGELDSDRRKNIQLTTDRDGLLAENKASQDEIPALKTTVQEQEAKLAGYQAAVDALKKLFAEMNVNDMSELNDKIKQLENDRVTREKELAETQALVEAANASIAKTEGQLADSRGRMAERSRALSQNASEPVIMAVNNDWGFVVLNAGSNQGFRPDQSLIVKRGESYVAKLSITSLHRTQMVADIVPSSVPKGMVVMPGDRVILMKGNN